MWPMLDSTAVPRAEETRDGLRLGGRLDDHEGLRHGSSDGSFWPGYGGTGCQNSPPWCHAEPSACQLTGRVILPGNAAGRPRIDTPDHRSDRAAGHHLRRVRPAHRLLPARRLAALHGRPALVPGAPGPAAGDPGRLLRGGGGRRPGRLRLREPGRSVAVPPARLEDLQAGVCRESPGLFREARLQDDRSGPVRSHRPDIRPDPRRRGGDAVPHVRDLQPARRPAVGRRA